MGYLSIQIIFFLLLAALLGFLIGWLLRGSRIQAELQELDGRWRTKLGDVENERDRFVNELTQANEARAKLEADLKRQSEDHDTKIAGFADTESVTAGLKSDLAAANERAATLEASLKEAKDANATCKGEVDRLNAEVAALKQAAADAPGTAAAGGAMGFMSGADSGSSASDGSAPAAAPSQLAESAGTDFVHASSDPSKGSTGGAVDDEENEGVKPELLTEARDGKADDLKKISGVGPKLEKTLNSLGVFHFSQIAEFTPDNVAWVDRHLRFKGRIAREKWIDQAKTLAAGGETEFSKRK